MSEKVLTFKQAKNRALKILEYRMHSEKEIYDKLRRAGAVEKRNFIAVYRKCIGKYRMGRRGNSLSDD